MSVGKPIGEKESASALRSAESSPKEELRPVFGERVERLALLGGREKRRDRGAVFRARCGIAHFAYKKFVRHVRSV